MASIIYRDLNETKFIFKYDNLTFFFSSYFYFNKFKREYSDFLNNETMKLKIKYRCNIYADEMILILLYKMIEKRGFKVKYKNTDLNERYLSKLIVGE